MTDNNNETPQPKLLEIRPIELTVHEYVIDVTEVHDETTSELKHALDAAADKRRPYKNKLPSYIENSLLPTLGTLNNFLKLIKNLPPAATCFGSKDSDFYCDAARVAHHFKKHNLINTIADIWPLTEDHIADLNKPFRFDLSKILNFGSAINAFIDRKMLLCDADVWPSAYHTRNWNFETLNTLNYTQIAALLRQADRACDDRDATHAFFEQVYARVETPGILRDYHYAYAEDWYTSLQTDQREFGLHSLKQMKSWGSLPRRDIIRHVEEVVRTGFAHDGLPEPFVTWARPSKELARGAAYYQNTGKIENSVIVLLQKGRTIEYDYLDTIYYAGHERGHHIEAALINNYPNIRDHIIAATSPDLKEMWIDDELSWLGATKDFRREIKSFPEGSRGYSQQPDERHAIDAGNIFAHHHVAALYRLEMDVEPKAAMTRMLGILRYIRHDILKAGSKIDALKPMVYMQLLNDMQEEIPSEPSPEPFENALNVIDHARIKLKLRKDKRLYHSEEDRRSILTSFADAYTAYNDLKKSSPEIKALFTKGGEEGDLVVFNHLREQDEIAWEALPTYINMLRLELEDMEPQAARPTLHVSNPVKPLIINPDFDII